MHPEVYTKVLERAIRSRGGVDAVATLLNTSRSEVADWLARRQPMPTLAFLRLVDCFMDDERDGAATAPVRIARRPPVLLPVVRQVAERALDEALDLHATGLGNVQLLNARGMLEIAAQRGFGPAFLDYFREVDAGDASVCGRALAAGEPVFVTDVQSDALLMGTQAQAVILAAGVRSVQSTPLVSATGDVFGMISTHFATPGGAHAGLPSLAPIARRFADTLHAWASPLVEPRLERSAAPFRS